MDYTKNKRQITVLTSDSPVTRIAIKRNELKIRYSKNCSEPRQDEIFDIFIKIEAEIPRGHATVRAKILDTDTLDTVQLEIGETYSQTKLIKHKGIDY